MKGIIKFFFQNLFFCGTMIFMLIFVFMLAAPEIITRMETNKENRFLNEVFSQNLPHLFEEYQVDRKAKYDVVISYSTLEEMPLTADDAKYFDGPVRVKLEIETDKECWTYLKGTIPIYKFRFSSMFLVADDEAEVKLAEANFKYNIEGEKCRIGTETEILGNYASPDYAGKNLVIDQQAKVTANVLWIHLCQEDMVVRKGLLGVKGDSS